MNTIEFPNLWNLKLTVNPVAFKILGLSVYWYGIIIAAAFTIILYWAMHDSREFGLDPDKVVDLALLAVPTAIVGARLYYVVFDFKEFKDDILSIFNTRTGGLAIYGAVIGGILAGIIFAKWKKISVLKIFDFGVPYLVFGQAVGRWGNFINQEAYGTNTQLPWGMSSEKIRFELEKLKALGLNIDPNLPVHPTFLYESLCNFAVVAFLIWYRKRKKFEGEIFYLYMILYGIVRFGIEGLRTDSLLLGTFRVSKILALVFVCLFTTLFTFHIKALKGKFIKNV